MRMMLLVFGLLAVVFMAMPTAMSKFGGQHTFVNGTNVRCTGCHPSVDSELSGNRPHVGNLLCQDCHIEWNYPKGTDWNELKTTPLTGGSHYYENQNLSPYHGAALVDCLWCHNTFKNNPARNNVKEFGNTVKEFNDSDTEAHRPLYFRSKNSSGVDRSDLLRGANEACIACHTPVANTHVTGDHNILLITSNHTCTNCYGGWNISLSR